jgi:crotonobetainyl-CoA:carnitine CoA-transferase CaiB-like acyl-CoA transferase
VARWRQDRELELLEAMLGKQLSTATVNEAEDVAAEARLMVVAVRHRPRLDRPEPLVMAAGKRGEQQSVDRWKVVDWSNLWAGPWATGSLAEVGADLIRVEVPWRRDGYLHTARGREIWSRWNGMKRLELLDVRTRPHHKRLEELLREAHLLVSGQTLRVLPQLGFGDEWFALEAPSLSKISLVAFAGQRQGLPGLGDQAAAAAGLLWNDGSRPLTPRPWADP